MFTSHIMVGFFRLGVIGAGFGLLGGFVRVFNGDRIQGLFEAFGVGLGWLAFCLCVGWIIDGFTRGARR